ncbi:MAG: galactose isomerase [Waddliaceae bacterium]|nr:galactose isomerase [Waddliaceae bacterium]
MKIAVSSDMWTPLVETLFSELKKRGHEWEYFGPKENEENQDWPLVTMQASEQISRGACDEGIVLCWTGTGASIVANKTKGIRAALCVDAETAKGARKWNHANVLALSLRLISFAIMEEILDAWFSTDFDLDPWNQTQVKRVQYLDKEPDSQ